MSSAIGSKLVEAVAVKTQPPQIESLLVEQEQPRVLWLQREGAIFMPNMPTKGVQVMEEPFKSMDRVENTQACSDVLEEQGKVQEDVLDTDYVKDPLSTNEDMQVNEGAMQSKEVGQLSPISMACSTCVQQEAKIQVQDVLDEETDDVCFFYSLLSDYDANIVLVAFSNSDMIMEVTEESLQVLLDEEISLLCGRWSPWGVLVDAYKDAASIVQSL
ncbi:hypothetical protein L7F22_051108, partial [Adiantum nelumboides]|nr:hypothetical protein [Adiantum nelumboides]